jgi:hypothetical protein
MQINLCDQQLHGKYNFIYNIRGTCKCCQHDTTLTLKINSLVLLPVVCPGCDVRMCKVCLHMHLIQQYKNNNSLCLPITDISLIVIKSLKPPDINNNYFDETNTLKYNIISNRTLKDRLIIYIADYIELNSDIALSLPEELERPINFLSDVNNLRCVFKIQDDVTITLP